MSKNKVRFFLGLIVFLVLLWGAFSISLGSEETKLILILTKDQSDTASLNPTRMQTATQMALDDYYRNSTNPLPIEHHYMTYIGEEEVGYEKAREFLEANPSVVALIGDFNSTGTDYLSKLAEEYQIPHISFFAADEDVFIDKPWSFSYRGRVTHETEMMYQILTDHLQVNNIAVISSDLRNLIPRWEELQSRLDLTGVGTSFLDIFPRTENDFKEQMVELEALKEEYDAVVLFLTSGQVEHFLQQMSLAGLDKPVVLTGITLSPESIVELKGIDLTIYSFAPEIYLKLQERYNPALQSLSVFQATMSQEIPPQDRHNPALQSFAEEYRVAIGYHRVDSLGPWIYDGTSLLYEIIEMTDNKNDIRKKLESYEGDRMVGSISFDQDGNLEKSTYSIVKIISGLYAEVSVN